ncbi:transporter [Vibrio cincinnatiensis]|uniref:transporter n=1 Tax=Vibrio cincinnatiensis TaxID=675 RepID=UPI001EE0E767|nr:transporter [Vibrio cincinnatiensis]MCG3728220.1 transporter [Vibrio cincinnatiensis]
MDQSQRVAVVFDYTSFLGVSCRKKWTFSEALLSFAPIFGAVWQDTVKLSQTQEERLWDMALRRLSSRRSDEANLITLLKLAKSEGIEELKLVMPYSLEPEQITLIQEKSASQIKVLEMDEFMITL